MTSRLRQHLTTMGLTLSLIVGGGMALAAVASDAPTETVTACPTDAVESPTPTDAPEAPIPTGDDVEGTDDEQGSDEQGSDDACDDAVDDQGEDVSDDGTDETVDEPPAEGVTDPDREAECTLAAGVDPTAPVDETERATGLDNAIAHVLANCLSNPDAPGLANALEHLVANAARKAAHEAAKAAGVHGNSANAPGHSGETHGNSANAPGHSGEHGNPHA